MKAVIEKNPFGISDEVLVKLFRAIGTISGSKHDYKIDLIYDSLSETANFQGISMSLSLSPACIYIKDNEGRVFITITEK